MQNIVCNTLFLLFEVKIFFDITYIFRGYKKGALGSNVLNTNLMFLLERLNVVQSKL